MDGIWAVLEQRLDFGSFVPRLVPNIERADLRTRDGTPYTVLKNTEGDGGAGTYVRLDAAYLELYELMDGERTTSAILVEHLRRRGYLAVDRSATLCANLAANGFFGEPSVDVYTGLRRRRASRDPLLRLSLLLRRLVMWNVATWANAEGAVDRLYRWGGRLAFTRAGALVVVLASILGIALWAREFTSPHHDLFRVGGSVAWGIVSLAILQVVAISVHEAGHALAVRHYGRRVRKLGLAVYYLFPCAYVDATDMVMAPRRQGMVVAFAGPLAGLSIAALSTLVMLLSNDAIVVTLAFKASSILVFQFVLNLLPILDMDGYHMLIDALDAPLLRQRALAFIRAGAIRKVRLRQPWKGSEILLGAYGALALLASLITLGLAALVWRARVDPLIGELAADGAIGLIALVALLVIFLGPIVVQLAMRVAGLGRTAIRTLGRARLRRDRLAVLAERAGILRRVRFLANLTPQALAALADHIQEVRVDAEDVVVTHGDAPDRFFIVRSGQLEAFGPDGQSFGRIVPGEGFGELALLDGTPRTATVRATQASLLWAIDKGHFNRWIRDRYEVAARIRASEEERERFAKIPFFATLGGVELQRLAAKVVTRRVRAGELVFSVGDPADRYYVIREGTAEVVDAEGRTLRTLGPDQDFGEIALLFGGGRTASVRAATDLVLMSLARADFAALVRASGETIAQFRGRTAHYENVPGLGSALAEVR